MQKGFSSLLIIIGLVVLLGVGGGLFYLSRSSSTDNQSEQAQFLDTNNSTPAPATTSLLTEGEDGRVTYTNKKYGIEFKYPKELYVFNDPYNNPNNENQLSLNKQDCNNFQGAYCGAQDSFFFRPVSAEGLSLDQWIKNNLFKKSNLHTPDPSSSGSGFADDGEYCYSRSKQADLVVGGIEAKSYLFSWDQLGHPGKCVLNKSYNENYPDVIKEIYLSKNGWIYVFDLRYKKGSDLEKTLDQILTTVKFIQ